jgi:hypothetical protein
MAKPANGPRLPSTGRLIWHQTPMCFLDTGLSLWLTAGIRQSRSCGLKQL